jgi:hypothetical protein
VGTIHKNSKKAFLKDMVYPNKGFDPSEIEKFRKELSKSGRNFRIVESEDNSEEYVNFQFIGMYEGREVIYDAVIYTLRLHHSSELYDLAEHKAAQRIPNFHPIRYDEDENGNMKVLGSEDEEMGLILAEIMAELEEEEAVKVQEHVDIDDSIDFGVALDIGLNVETVSDRVIEQFIKNYNDDNLKLDPTLYSFVNEEEE